MRSKPSLVGCFAHVVLDQPFFKILGAAGVELLNFFAVEYVRVKHGMKKSGFSNRLQLVVGVTRLERATTTPSAWYAS